MYLERLLQINIATLAALGTLLLGMGQRNAALPMAMLIAAIVSVWLTDITGRLRLNRAVTSIAALIAVMLALVELFRLRTGGFEVLGIANLLVYLQIVLLFQKKDHRVYWQLAMLSLLQVVVAAAYSQGVGYGALLVVYMLLGLSALGLMFLHRQWNRHAVDDTLPAATGAGRWPLACLPSGFTSTPAGPCRLAIGREWFARLGLMGLGTLVLTLLMFLTVPRLGRTAWRGASITPRRVVGFDDKITLGELGRIIESPRDVMRVELRSFRTGEPHGVLEEIYLRGAVLTRYGGNTWRPPRARSGSTGPLPTVGALGRGPRNALLIQKISIEPTRGHNEVFAIWPFVVLQPNENLWYDQGRRRLVRPSDQRGVRFTYLLGTRALSDHEQTPLVPYDEPENVEPLLQMPKLPRLAATAQRWVEQSGLPAGDRVAVAQVLERKFHDPTAFQYSLEGQPRDPDLDNIEDFLVNNPRGHCEYFATALTLMLRSQGIPSRVIVGYRCDEYNEAGEFYQVRQLHAHTWVEAYLRQEDIPDTLVHNRDSRRWADGAWLRLEPTPGAMTAESLGSAGGTLFGRLEQSLQWLESLWANYVVEMDRSRQYQVIYQPVVRAAQNAVACLSDPNWWRGLTARLAGAFDFSGWLTVAGWWRWLALAVLAALSVLLLVRMRRCLARLSAWLWARLTGRRVSPTERGQSNVAFYRRLEAVLARHGVVRRAGQTPREYAAAAGTRVAAATGQPRLALLPPQVVESFYRVRFGHLPLDTAQASAVEQALVELSDCIAATQPHHARRHKSTQSRKG